MQQEQQTSQKPAANAQKSEGLSSAVQKANAAPNPILQELYKLYFEMVDKGAADLFITSLAAPSIKLFGKMQPLRNYKCTPAQADAFVTCIMNPKQLKEFRDTRECNYSIAVPGLSGRFRVSAFQQREQSGMVCRRITSDIPTMEQMGLPSILGDLIMNKMGLLIMVGATGSGKSTTLASMINHRNINTQGHIITLEDPVEFTHEHKGCIITQREVGADTMSFEEAMKGALRQAPDVILVGEIRTRETMEYALTFAGTGHLALATLHANTAAQALNRMVNLFPESRHAQIWEDLSINLRGIVAQQLIPKKGAEGRWATQEILVNTPRCSDLIKKSDIQGVQELLDSAKGDGGVQSFDYDLFKLVKADKITDESAFRAANSANNLRLMLDLAGDQDLKEKLTNATEGLKLKEL